MRYGGLVTIRTDRPVITLAIASFLMLTTLCFVPPSSAQTWGMEVSEDILVDTGWNSIDSPVHVTASITVWEEATLTIEPGVEVKFEADTGITFYGKLKASGVTFTSALMPPSKGDWNGLEFRTSPMDNEPLIDNKIHYAGYALEFDETNATVQGGRLTNYEDGGIYNSVGSVTVKGVEMNSTSGMGIRCTGPLTATNNLIVGEIAVGLYDGCKGTMERNVIQAGLTGISMSNKVQVTIRENLIESTDPGDSFGLSIPDGSTVTVTKNDIVGHLYGINLQSKDADLDGNSIRAYSGYGIYSNQPVTIDGGFWGTPDPKAAMMVPNAANDEVTITNPLDKPFDIVGIDQPASVVVTSHNSYAMVKGEVLVAGMAYDPDPSDDIYGVEGRVIDLYEGIITDWTYCDGLESWTYYWDTDPLETNAYKLEFRVEQEEGYSPTSLIYLTVNPFAAEKVHLNEPNRVTETSISVSWTYQDGADFKAYRVYYDTDPISDTTKLTPKIVTNYAIKSTTLTGLDKDTRYFVLVVVETDSGLKHTSNQIEAWTSTTGGGSTNWDLFNTICLGMVLIIVLPIIIIIVVVVYLLVIRPKRMKAKAPPPTPPPITTQAQYRPAQAQASHGTTPTPADETTSHAKVEPFIIEDVFLVYRDGRLIHHDTRRLKPDMDDQMLSGMFTAIQEFINQSLTSIDDEGSKITEIMYGESRIILEHGQFIYLAVLASDIKDTRALHERMARLIGAIEAQYGDVLTTWDGNMSSVRDAARTIKILFTDHEIEG